MLSLSPMIPIYTTHEAFHASGQASILHLQVRGISKSAFVPENETEQLIIQLQQCPGI